MTRQQKPESSHGRAAERRSGHRSRADILRDVLFAALRNARARGHHTYAALGIYLVGGMAVAAAGTVGFALIAGRVAAGATQHMDTKVLTWMALHQVPWAEAAMLEITFLGTGLVVLTVVGVSATFLWLTRQRQPAVLLLVATAGGLILNGLLKLGFDRPRPQLFAWGTHVVTSSFPSGHAMSATIVYGTVAYLAARLEGSRAARIATFALAGLMISLICTSRLYLGVHYPSDIIAGIAVGLAWAAFCMVALEGLAVYTRHDARARMGSAADDPSRRVSDVGTVVSAASD
ncbi:MAG: hypothetical protein NVS4B3_10300 [Gemmatimonadaceae bacterium]